MDRGVSSSPGPKDEAMAGIERPDDRNGDIDAADTIQNQRRKDSQDGPGKVSRQTGSPVQRLPSEVIEHILYVVDANSFASLALLNREWRRVSDSPQLYAYHLSRCPSFSLTTGVISGTLSSDDLPELKGRFACEIRRNAFEVFLRPRRTLIKLISASVSSSTAFPFGEAFRFSFSANGRMLLCLSSSRIFVIDLSSDLANVKHELKTLRRPLAATILDDGTLLAVVSSKHQVNIYRLSEDEARHIQVLALNDTPRALALSPIGSVLAIAYDSGIEVYALGENALATERRAVRCISVDSVSFSADGTMLLGSSTDVKKANIVTISAPFCTDVEMDVSIQDAQSRMWTTQILFPDIIRGYSHVSLLPIHLESEGSWVVGYDNQLNTFRAVRVDNARTGVTYFVGPQSRGGSEEPQPLTMPAPDSRGELVALGFRGSGLWLYGLPARCDIAPLLSPSLGANSSRNSSQALVNGDSDEPPAAGEDNSRRLRRSINQPSILVHGHKLVDIPGITAAHWVQPPQSSQNNNLKHRRLVAAAPGGISSSALGEENVPIDGGRILIFDFERSTTDGGTTEVTIEVGEAEPKMLKEQNPSLDAEVELERRRTQSHRALIGSPRHGLGQRSANASRESFPAATTRYQKLLSSSRRASHSQPSSPTDLDLSENTQVLDSPYDNTQPRSRDTLHRAATAAAASRGRYNPRYREIGNPVALERQIPHESDADNWVPPPPPYTREPDAPLPEHFSRLLLPAMTEPTQRVSDAPPQVQRAHTSRLETMAQNAVARSRSTIDRMNTISSSRLTLRRRRSSREISNSGRGEQTNRQRSVLQRTRESPSSNLTDVSAPAQTSTMQFPTQLPGRDSAVSAAAATENSNQVDPRPEWRPPSPYPTIEDRDLASLSGQVSGAFSGLPRINSQQPSAIGATLQEPVDLPVPPLPQTARALQETPNFSLPLPPPQTAPQRANLDGRRSRSRPRSFATHLLTPSRSRRAGPSAGHDSGAVHIVSSSGTIEPSPAVQLGSNNSRTSYHSYSVSSPDLRFRQSGHNDLDTFRSGEPRSGGQGGIERSRSRSQDIRSPLTLTSGTAWGATPAGNRVSTDPTDARLPQDEQVEDWRARIEQWNVRTINERRKKGHNKCSLM